MTLNFTLPKQVIVLLNITIDTPMYDEKEYQPEQPSFKLDDLYVQNI